MKPFTAWQEIPDDLRQEIESNLQQSESRFLKLLEATFEGLAIHENGVIIEANEGFAQMFGYELSELIGALATDLAIPEHHERIMNHILTGYDKPYEVVGRRRDGTRIHVEMLGQNCVYQGRNARIAAFRDVTERHRMEATLRAQNEKLKELDRLKNNFISTVSHELRTPLAAIMGYAEFLEDEISGRLNADQQNYVLQISKGARKLRLLVDDLLDVARFDSGSFHLNPRVDDLARTVREIIGTLQPQAQAAKIHLESLLPICPVLLVFDPDRIGQVLLNLLGNALKFTPAGGTIQVRLVAGGHHVGIEVQDSGIGISPENEPKVFQKFYQIDPGSTREKGGAGLGLSISKALVEAHGGQIGVESRLGAGSKFWFKLPNARWVEDDASASAGRSPGPRLAT